MLSDTQVRDFLDTLNKNELLNLMFDVIASNYSDDDIRLALCDRRVAETTKRIIERDF